MNALAMKLTATLLTAAGALGFAVYVGGHEHNPSAPLRPPVSARDQGTIGLGPSVRASDVQPVSSTYAS